MKYIKKLLMLMGILITLFVGFVVFIVITDFDPALEEDSIIMRDNGEVITGYTFSLTTFNIGYGGLDDGQDFFLDGGTMSRTSSKDQTLENLENIETFIETQNSDFYFLQEVDVKGTRSANVDQRQSIFERFADYSVSFSYNFKAKWIPIPIFNPLGSAYSGLMTLSRFSPDASTRYRLPGEEP
ncbi:MAG: endonuclease/exonuclease/phosphatase family protein, partial [Firmicutes bacterium]|nr:endonuclease/exonuclease/phosphatase family protein [Bacillota bacterium]